jgi:hypothetical protein
LIARVVFSRPYLVSQKEVQFMDSLITFAIVQPTRTRLSLILIDFANRAFETEPILVFDHAIADASHRLDVGGGFA